MRDWTNRILTNLKDYVNDSTVEFSTTNDIQLINKTVWLQRIGNLEVGDDLEATETNAEEIEVQLDVYAKTLTEATALANKVGEGMRKMCFARTYGFQVMTNLDTNYKRVVARYKRTIGSGEEINYL